MMAAATLVGAMVWLPAPPGHSSLPLDVSVPSSARRRMVAAGFLSTLVAGVRPVSAFDNGIEEMAQYRSRIKYPGTQPELGVKGNGKLAACDYSPNCFSTSGDESHLLPLWKPRAGSNAMGELLATIKAYPPFQRRADGGGFKIITANDDYLYVQFESLKNGFIDDVEFAVNAGKVQVRSSSRIGFLDFGVNSRRLNWISSQLRELGWTAPAITKDNPDYNDYFVLLNFNTDDYVRSVLSPSTCPNPSIPLECKGKAGVIP